jgi:copper(I)-binding protein
MSAVGRIPLPARQTTAMKPGGLHFMLMELKQPLREGATFPLTCRFANAGTVTIEVRILAAGSMGPQATAAPTGSPH